MAYIGIGPASFTNNLTNVQILDDISGDFDGNTPTFNLTANDVPFHAVSDRALMVILGGVIQAPGVDYTINLAQITFTTNPVSGLTFYARNIYGLNALNGVNDGIVGPYSLTTGGPSWDTSGNTTISGNLTVQGATTTIQSTTLDVIDKDIKLASNQSNNAGIDTAGLLWGTTAVKLKYYNNGGTNPGLNIEGTNVGIGQSAPEHALDILKTSGAANLRLKTSANSFNSFIMDSNRAADTQFAIIDGRWNGNVVNRIQFVTGGDGTNKDDGYMAFHTRESGQSLAERLTITSAGHITPGAAGTQDLGSTSKEFRHIYHGDSGKAFFGLDQDLSVYHNNSHAYIQNSTGSLLVEGNSVVLRSLSQENYLVGTVNGSVELYDNNIKTFQTDANGIRVLGPDGGVGNIELFADRGDDNADKWRFQATASGSNLSIQNYVNGSWETSVKATGNSHTELYHGDDIRFRTNGDGAEFFDSDNNCNVYFTCNGTRRGYLFVDATNGGKIGFMDPQNHWLISGTKNSSVDLYHDNTLRLQTSSTGITVTGEVAATQDYPNYRPLINWNFAATKKLDSRLTYTRTGAASYVDQLGKVVLVGANVPRFDHDPLTGECKGLLIEPSRTNILPNSFDTESAWNSGSAGTLTRNAGIAPDGTMTATKAAISSNDIDTSPALGPASAGATTQITISGSTTYTLSIWAKASTTAQVGNNFKVRWKRITGDSVSAETTFALTADWQRYSTTGTTAANNTTMSCYVGGVSGSEALVWGAQLEVGSYATSLIPTYGSSRTRGSDFAYLDGTAGTEFDDIYDPLQGTFVIDWFNDPNGNFNDGYVFALDDGSGNNRIGAVNSNNYQVTVVAGGSSQGTRDLGSINSGKNKIAFTYKHNDQATSLNGSDVSVDTSSTVPSFTGSKYWWLGLRQGAYDQLGGYISNFSYYPRRLTNAQLKNLSS